MQDTAATVEPPPNIKLWQARQRGEEIVTSFDRLWPEYSRRQRGLPAHDSASRRSLDYLHPDQLQLVVDYGRKMRLRAMQVALDCKAQGAEARQWYADTLPGEFAWMLPTDVDARDVTTPRRAESSGRPAVRGASRRSSQRSGDSGDDGPSDEPPPLRLCENKRCGADISHLGPKAYHCDNGGACKQAAYRDRQTLEHLDDLVGTTTTEVSCECDPKGHLVIGGVCFPCGRPRGAVTCEWLDGEGVPARSFVVTPAAPDNWRTRPDRKLAAKLRGTRRDRTVAREQVAA